MTIPKTLRSSNNSGFLDSSRSDPKNSWCSTCKRIPLAQIFRPSRLQRQKRYKISRPTTPGCPMCQFIRQLEQLDSQSSDDEIGDISTDASSLLLSTFDTNEPWWHVLGLCTSRPAPSFAWFQREGSAPASKSERPLVLITCVSTENVASALNISVPRRRPEAEQHQGIIDLEVVKSWLQTCDQKHGAACRIEADRSRKPRNLRLIDIRSRDIVGSDTDARYVALSYVWGSRSRTSHGHLPSNPSTSDLSGLAEVSRLRRVPHRLPATFEDAITVCKALGEQFLWIDLFCIDQTNSHELQDQINQMNTIYQSAAFTIIARDFDAHGGLPSISRLLRKRHQPVLSTPHGELLGTHIRPAVALSGKSPWDLRGWTLQESLFSHRRLMFSIHTVRLICQQEYFHDNLVNTICPRHPVTFINRFDWWDSANSIDLRLSCWDFRTFNALISVYTYRILRYPGDILNACRGALLELESRTRASFSYGVPTTDAHRALLWSSHSSHTLSRRPGRWPSWSWCGWLGRVAWREWIVDMLDYEGEADVHDPHVSILNRKKIKRRRVDDDHSAKLASAIQSNHSTLRGTIWPALLRFPEIEDHDTLAILKISSLIAPCILIKATSDPREPTILTYANDETGTATKKDLGYHWTLLSPNSTEPLKDLANSTGEPDIFTTTDHFLRLSEAESRLLEMYAIDVEGSTRQRRNERDKRGLQVPAELVLIKHWDLIRDSEHHDAWLADMVGCLVVVPVEDEVQDEQGTETKGENENEKPEDDIQDRGESQGEEKMREIYQRIGMVLLERGIFEAFKPASGERDVV